jgi:hypothetical protein
MYKEILESINTGDEKALTKLKGIGVQKAKRLISYREEFGHFSSVCFHLSTLCYAFTFCFNLFYRISIIQC